MEETPCKTSKELGADPERSGVEVSAFTLHTKPSRAPWRKPPQSFWNNVLWTDETKVELFGDPAHWFDIRGYN